MSSVKKKKLPIGVSNFQKIIEKDYYYVDKSLLIKEILDSGTEIFLITRPRRFGKTLNLSMLRCFFEIPKFKIPNLFQHLKIWQTGDEYIQHYQKYPLIYFTFKDVKEDNWENCLKHVKKIISEEFERHTCLLESNSLSPFHKREFQRLVNMEADDVTFGRTLKTLSNYLHQYYSEKVIILIDEYDTPIHAAYEYGYYQKAIDFFRTFFGAGLKDNSNLERGVITGILRIAKENVFSGLNNLDVLSILDYECADKFGFTESEVIQILKDYDMEERLEEVKTWYNGYVFGDVHGIYNPWSIINYVKKYKASPQAYWVNTSSNTLINTLLSKGDREVKNDLECLLNHKPISKVIHTNTVFSDIEKDSSHLWSFLLFSGYLKATKKNLDFNNELECKLVIPNEEVFTTYRIFAKRWFSDNLPNMEIDLLINSLFIGDTETFEDVLQKYVLNSISYFDPTGEDPEKVYHAFVLGLLIHTNQTHLIQSNRESGFGRYDIMLVPHKKSDAGVIIEFKKVKSKKGETLETACESALNQIEEKSYEVELRKMGVENILKYGIAFEGKKVLVVKG